MKKINALYKILVLLTLLASAQSMAGLGSAVLKKEYEARLAKVPFQPLIEVSETGKKASPFFLDMQDTLLRMNDLSYNRVKAGDAYLRFADDEHTRLEREGWEIRSFRGLEGKRSNYIDLSGIISYHSEKNVITVVYHGTAGNKEGWDTNFDAEQMDPKTLLIEFSKDLHAELKERLKGASFNAGVNGLKKVLKATAPEQFNSLKMSSFIDLVEELTANGDIDAVLSQYLTAPIRLKLELVSYIERTGMNIEGKLHKGFAKKYFSSKSEVLAILKHFIERLPSHKAENVKIIFSGHSQAGGTGNLALADIAANHGQDLFGSRIANKDTGTFYGYFLSAARVGDKHYVQWLHDNVGRDYIARQNVDGDPVPVASGDSEMAKLLKASIPVIGDLLAMTANFDDSGHLLLDDGNDAWQRARALYVRDGVNVAELESLTDGLYSAVTMFVSPDAIPGFIAPKAESCSWNPITKVRSCVNVIGLANTTLAAFKGNERAQNELSDLVAKRYAHLHHGRFRPAMGTTAFDPDVVSRNIDQMLNQGAKHEGDKLSRKAQSKQLERHNSRMKVMRDLYPKTLSVLPLIGA